MCFIATSLPHLISSPHAPIAPWDAASVRPLFSSFLFIVYLLSLLAESFHLKLYINPDPFTTLYFKSFRQKDGYSSPISKKSPKESVTKCDTFLNLKRHSTMTMKRGTAVLRPILFILLGICLLDVASAATIKGHVYDLDLAEIHNAIIEIDTEPVQRLVSRDGMYSFDIPPGEYTLVATVRSDDISSLGARESVNVEGGGEYIFDLFLYENFEEEDELLAADDLTLQNNLFNDPRPTYIYYLIAFGVALVVAALLYLLLNPKRKQRSPEQKNAETKKTAAVSEHSPSKDKEAVLSIIKKNDGRITQRDLRKELPHSEAKVSLIIAELEGEGRIKKIKKGRGNILILQ